MNIHEYQGKALLKKFGVPVPSGGVAKTSKGAMDIAKKLGAKLFVVKSQIHAGGRGKGTLFKIKTDGSREVALEGGVQLAKTVKQVGTFTTKMVSNHLVTHQSGEEGKRVNQVLIEEGMAIKKELYLGAVLDRERSQWVIMISTEGGMDIEKVAAETPEKIHKVHIDPAQGLLGFQVRELAFSLKLNNPMAEKNIRALIPKFYDCFSSMDCSICEINPLVILKDDSVIALDAKFNFDSNALHRHPDIYKLRDTDEESPLEVEASKFGLNYIKLDGNIGCMVNGAGLAMATMDIIKYAGGEPANFLDVGGGVSEKGVANAFKIILSDKSVQGIFINIFGGIAKCDLIARGIIGAAKKVKLKIPCVVRLDGTNAEIGRNLISKSGLGFLEAETMKEGAYAIVNAIAGKGKGKAPKKKSVTKRAQSASTRKRTTRKGGKN